MFIRKRHLAKIEETLYQLQHRCAALETEIRQMKCDHDRTDFEPVSQNSAWGLTIKYAPDVKCQEVCARCRKVLGYCTAEEKARKEYEAARDAYNSVMEPNQ